VEEQRRLIGRVLRKGLSLPDFDADLNYLRAGLHSLEAYLLSNKLYWPIRIAQKSGEAPYPSLTLSGLLLARARMRAYHFSGSAQFELERMEGVFDHLMSQWRVAWERKATREFTARLNLWRSYLEDYREQPENHADRYAYEVSRRVMLELLLPYVPGPLQAEMETLKGLDGVLKSVFIPGEFIWGESLKDSFPSRTYWYLYGTLR